MDRRPLLPETGEEWLPSTNWLSSAPNLSFHHPKSGLETQNRLDHNGHLSPKIGDRWRLSQNGPHSHYWSIHHLPRAGPTHKDWFNSPLVTRAQREGVHMLSVWQKISTEIGWHSTLHCLYTLPNTRSNYFLVFQTQGKALLNNNNLQCKACKSIGNIMKPRKIPLTDSNSLYAKTCLTVLLKHTPNCRINSLVQLYIPAPYIKIGKHCIFYKYIAHSSDTRPDIIILLAKAQNFLLLSSQTVRIYLHEFNLTPKYLHSSTQITLSIPKKLTFL